MWLKLEINEELHQLYKLLSFVLIKNTMKAVMKWHVHIWLLLIFRRFEQTSMTTASELNISTYNTTTFFIHACIFKCTKSRQQSSFVITIFQMLIYHVQDRLHMYGEFDEVY